MALIGYIWVSTSDQNPDLQRDAMREAGVARVFEDIGVSGTRTSRPGLDEAVSFLREDDTLVLWKLDRLGRRTPHLIEFVNGLRERGVHLRILEGVMAGTDTSTSMGSSCSRCLQALPRWSATRSASARRPGFGRRPHAGARAGGHGL